MIIYVNDEKEYKLTKLLKMGSNMFFETTDIDPSPSKNSGYITVMFDHIKAAIMGKQIYSDPAHKTSMKYEIEEKDLPIMKSLVKGIFNYDL